jgi:hypothetical protein
VPLAAAGYEVHLLDPICCMSSRRSWPRAPKERRLRGQLSGTPAGSRIPTPARRLRCCSGRCITSPSGRTAWRPGGGAPGATPCRSRCDRGSWEPEVATRLLGGVVAGQRRRPKPTALERRDITRPCAPRRAPRQPPAAREARVGRWGHTSHDAACSPAGRCCWTPRRVIELPRSTFTHNSTGAPFIGAWRGRSCAGRARTGRVAPWRRSGRLDRTPTTARCSGSLGRPAA